MLNKPPSKAVEKAWFALLASFGCVILSKEFGMPVTGGVQIHHPGGRELKKNKLYIGRYFCYPLAWKLHDIYSPHPYNVSNHKNKFVEIYGRECDLFHARCMEIVAAGHKLPFGDDVMQAIMDTGI